ncbi:ComEC family competence protein [Candidatus Peregrinibacteria bacterium]|nr:ComEC family competence protein [Candidatus Peregrinibacteria bacterium]
MKRVHIFSCGILFFLLGVGIADFLRSPLFLLGILIFPCILIFRYISFRVLIFWIIFFLLGGIRIFIALPNISREDVAFFASPKETARSVEIQGIISEYPDERGEKTKIILHVTSLFLRDTKEMRLVSGNILVSISKYPPVFYGDMLHISGKLQIPPEWEDFSYARFLEKNGIYSYMPWGTFEIRSRGNGSIFFRTLFELRRYLENLLKERIPEPEASFSIGILLGGEQGFPEELVEEFRKTGLSHVLALSGFNITILILFVFWIFRFLPKKINLFLTLLFISSFVLLTGASSSVVRAAIMGGISLLVLHFGFVKKAFSILLWSIFCMVLWNPFLLLSDISFQLSVAAVLGLIAFSPLWKDIFQKLPGTFGLRESLETTLAAQIIATPLIAFYFHRISLISPIANLLIAPCIPVAMLFSFLGIFPFVGKIFAFCAFETLRVALAIIHVCSEVPYSDIPFSLGIFGLTFFYVFVGLLWWRHQSRKIKNLFS